MIHLLERPLPGAESAQRRGRRAWACLALAALAATGTAPAWAASGPPLRIGFINTQRILQDSALAQRDSAALRAEFEPRNARIKALAQQAATQRKRLQDNTLVMSDDQRLAAQAQLTETLQRLHDAQAAFADDLNARRSADVQSLLNQADAAVDKLARQRHLSVVFQSAVYVNPRIDLTDAVIRAMDASTAPTAQPTR